MRTTYKYEENWDNWNVQELEQYIRRVGRSIKRQQTIQSINDKVLRIAQNLALDIHLVPDNLENIQNMIPIIVHKLKELNIENKTIGELITLNRNNRRKEFRERKNR